MALPSGQIPADPKRTGAGSGSAAEGMHCFARNGAILGKESRSPAAAAAPFAPYGCAPRGMLREAKPLGGGSLD
jgi:hypothetical protein